MANQPDDHFSYGCFSRTPRRSPAGGNQNNNNARRGLFHMGHGGRTVLPPLHLPFRASRSPAPDPSLTSAQYPQQDPQARGDYNIQGYNQSGWPVNPTHQQQNTFQDPRFAGMQAQYGMNPTRAQSAMIPDPHDSRILPPPNAHGQPNQAMMGGAQIRSPTAGYPAAFVPYPEHPQQPFFSPPDPRNLPPPVPSMGHDPSSGMMHRRSSMSVDRTIPSRMTAHGPSPYPRNPSIASTSTYAPEQPVSEPSIKKKRKRADAEQLKVLNETYNRTAFPTTEERAELAKRLSMSARSVQIWFQNKRQAMRQSSRQASTSIPPTTNEPYGATPHQGAGIPATNPYGVHPSASASAGPAYGGPMPHRTASRLIPSPAPAGRPRSREEEERDPRRFTGRQY